MKKLLFVLCGLSSGLFGVTAQEFTNQFNTDTRAKIQELWSAGLSAPQIRAQLNVLSAFLRAAAQGNYNSQSLTQTQLRQFADQTVASARQEFQGNALRDLLISLATNVDRQWLPVQEPKPTIAPPLKRAPVQRATVVL